MQICLDHDDASCGARVCMCVRSFQKADQSQDLRRGSVLDRLVRRLRGVALSIRRKQKESAALSLAFGDSRAAGLRMILIEAFLKFHAGIRPSSFELSVPESLRDAVSRMYMLR